jgi:hypothetical protein
MGAVSGPADAPPESSSSAGEWVKDWAGRAHSALKKANEWIASGKRAATERARRVASRISTGIRNVWAAHPVSKASKALQSLSETANAITLATVFGTGVATIVLVIGVAWWFTKKG